MVHLWSGKGRDWDSRNTECGQRRVTEVTHLISFIHSIIPESIGEMLIQDTICVLGLVVRILMK